MFSKRSSLKTPYNIEEHKHKVATISQRLAISPDSLMYNVLDLIVTRIQDETDAEYVMKMILDEQPTREQEDGIHALRLESFYRPIFEIFYKLKKNQHVESILSHPDHPLAAVDKILLNKMLDTYFQKMAIYMAHHNVDSVTTPILETIFKNDYADVLNVINTSPLIKVNNENNYSFISSWVESNIYVDQCFATMPDVSHIPDEEDFNDEDKFSLNAIAKLKP